jgi:gamma-glutamylcyclotransferase (GGCT)/AIG2-like uncharacterized protein YtfP
MATNQPTIRAWGDFSNMLDNILSLLRSGSVISSNQLDELEAYNRLLKKHVAAQRKQDGQFRADAYTYHLQPKNLERWRRGNLVSEV